MCTLRSIHQKCAVGWCIVINKDMGTIKIIDGNIFNSKAQTIVNTVNCVGVMGKGIALVFKLRYPKLFEKYQELCRQRLIEVGKLWLYREEPDAPWVLNNDALYLWFENGQTGTGVENIWTDNDTTTARKLIMDGQVVIIRDGKLYNVMGYSL